MSGLVMLSDKEKNKAGKRGRKKGEDVLQF